MKFSIDVDILNLVDDFNIDAFVKEASVALEDDAMLREFIKEKATIMVERILVSIFPCFCSFMFRLLVSKSFNSSVL